MLKKFHIGNKYLLISVIIFLIWIFPPAAYFFFACSKKMYIGAKKIIIITFLLSTIAVIIFYGGTKIKKNVQKVIYEKIFVDNYIKIVLFRGDRSDIHEFWLSNYKVSRYETSTMQTNYLKGVLDDFTFKQLESYGNSLQNNINFEFSTSTHPLTLQNGLTGVQDKLEIVLQKNDFELLCFWNIIPFYLNFDNSPQKNEDGSYIANIIYKSYVTDVDNNGNIKKINGEFVFKEYSNRYEGKIYFAKTPFLESKNISEIASTQYLDTNNKNLNNKSSKTFDFRQLFIPVKEDIYDSIGYEYLNSIGDIVIKPLFRTATLFRDEIALVQPLGKTPKWGYINRKGDFVIKPIYKNATIFSEGFAWVVETDSCPICINKFGNKLFELQNAETVNIFKEGMAGFSVIENGQKKYGFVDTNGKIAISPKYDYVSNFSEGKCAVKLGSKWGYINKLGTLVLEYQLFEFASNFSHGSIIIGTKDWKYGVINEKGKYIIMPKYSSINNDEDLYIVEIAGKFGWCSHFGEIIIQPQFKDAGKFGLYDLAPVKIGDKWGYINKEGIVVISPKFKYAFCFFNNLAVVVLDNDKLGFIDNKGSYIIKPYYKVVSSELLTLKGFVTHSTDFESVESDSIL